MSKNNYIPIEPPLVVWQGNSRPVFSKAWSKGDLRIWITRDTYTGGGQAPIGQLRWHMSISTATRYPVWDEIRDAWYHCAPQPDCKDVTVGMLLPPKGEYVNLHPNCFHLHEIVE